MTNTSNNEAVNASLRAMVRKTAATPTAPAPSQNAQEATQQPRHGAEVGMNDTMRGMLQGNQQRQLRGGGGTLPDAGAIAFALAARRAGAKNPAELYRAVRDEIVVNIPGDVLTDVDGLVQRLRRENPSAFMRFTVDAGAGQGDATAGYQPANGGGTGDPARLAFALKNAGR